MPYILPRQAVYPLGRVGRVTVIHDGGYYNASNPLSGFSVAELIWDGEQVLAMRWNCSENPGVQRGFPLLHGGLPGWFVVPEVFADGIRKQITERKTVAA